MFFHFRQPRSVARMSPVFRFPSTYSHRMHPSEDGAAWYIPDDSDNARWLVAWARGTGAAAGAGAGAGAGGGVGTSGTAGGSNGTAAAARPAHQPAHSESATALAARMVAAAARPAVTTAIQELRAVFGSKSEDAAPAALAKAVVLVVESAGGKVVFE